MKQLLENHPLILAERLRRIEDITLYPPLFNTPLIHEESGARAMRSLYLEKLMKTT